MRVVSILLLLVSSGVAQKRPINHEDVWLMKRVGRSPFLVPNFQQAT